MCLRCNAPWLEFPVTFFGSFWKNGGENGALRYRQHILHLLLFSEENLRWSGGFVGVEALAGQ